MFHTSRLFLKSALKPLTFGALSGALLLAPIIARAQDVPAAPPEAPPAAPPEVAPAAGTPATAPKPVTTAWTTFKGDQQRTGSTSANIKLPLSLQWRYSSVGPARPYTAAPLVIGAPGNQIIVFATGNVIYATDVNTGAQVWKSPELKSTVSTPLALLSTEGGDLILALQNNGLLAAFKTANGARAWEVDCGALATESGPVVVQTAKGTRVICALNTGNLVAVDPGGVIDADWKMRLGQVGTSAASSPAISRDGSKMFVLGSDARLYIISVREARTLYSIAQNSRSGATPIVNGDVVYTANSDRVSAWRIGDGTAAWKVSPGSDVIASPALMPGANGGQTGSVLFFGTRDGQFMGVDALTGEVKWKKKLVDNVSVTGSPLVMPGAVVVGTAAGTLVGFSPDKGDIIWQYRLQTERVRDLTPKPVNAPNFGGGDGNFGGPGSNFGGPGGGNAGDGTTGADEEKRTYGVSSAPAAIDNKMFVLGDDAALYAFTSQPFDSDPPRVIEPSIAVNATDRQLLSLLLSPATPQVVPGVGPFYFAAQIDDVGSGVDPASIVVTINDKPLEASRVFYGRASSVLTVTLVDPDKGDPTLEDGLKKVGITAKDYAGNVMNFTTDFSVDNTVPAPTPPVDPTQNGGADGGAPGGAAMGGNMGP